MSPARQRLLAFSLLVLAVVAIAFVVQQLLVVLVSAGVAAVVAILVHRRLAEGTPSPTEAAAPDATDAWIAHLGGLVALNLQIRENAFPADVVAKLESNIDALRDVIPELNDDHVGSELTWTVNRMATDYLPRIVVPYAKLSPPGREEHREEFLRSLEGLEGELANIRELLRNARVGEFKTKAAFLRARFLDSDLG